MHTKSGNAEAKMTSKLCLPPNSTCRRKPTPRCQKLQFLKSPLEAGWKTESNLTDSNAEYLDFRRHKHFCSLTHSTLLDECVHFLHQKRNKAKTTKLKMSLKKHSPMDEVRCFHLSYLQITSDLSMITTDSAQKHPRQGQ